jgi:hypothetical protein
VEQPIERDLDGAVGGEGGRADVGADDGERRGDDDLIVLRPLVARGGAEEEGREGERCEAETERSARSNGTGGRRESEKRDQLSE